MRTPLKIFFAWTMLMLMAHNIAGYFLFYFLSERENRIEMQEFLEDTDESELVLITFVKTPHNTCDSFIRKNNHEIIVDGKIYDVKKEYTKSGTTYFYCINDSEEEQLNKLFSEISVLNQGIITACEFSPFKKAFIFLKLPLT